jgi:two-component system sensor kinase FixL
MNNLSSFNLFWRVAGFLTAYLLLDMLSGPEARFQSIAPVWHPAAGLALWMVLRFGRGGMLILLLAALLAAWVTPPLPLRPGLSFFVGLVPLVGYCALGYYTRRHLPDGAFFASHRGVLVWTSIVASTNLINGGFYSSMVFGMHAIGTVPWVTGVIHYVIAETAGMLVVVPLAYCMSDNDLRGEFIVRVLKWETLAYSALMAMVLFFALRHPASDSVVYYLLFLPLVWAAARQGMAGAVCAAVVLEVGVTAAAIVPSREAARIPDVQMLVMMLTLSGFLIGVAVDIAQRASQELRQSLRLAAAGEMAAALAHELNQPLTALSVYASACQRLAGGEDADPLLQKTIHSMVHESQRASNVLKRLREFFRTGSTALEHLSLSELIQSAVDPFFRQAHDSNIALVVESLPEITISGDRVQLEIVLRNILANAVQALEDVPEQDDRRVTVTAQVEGNWVSIRIADNGPGIANKIRARLFEPFISLKSSGLGLGLAISRSIVETHGGALTVEPSPHGVLRIKLPIETSKECTDHV